jgi:hypothetical protein
VDDLIIVSPIKQINRFKTSIASKFQYKELGQARYLLGIELTIINDASEISQQCYIEQILRRYNMDRFNGHQTPLDPNCFSRRAIDADTDPLIY